MELFFEQDEWGRRPRDACACAGGARANRGEVRPRPRRGGRHRRLGGSQAGDLSLTGQVIKQAPGTRG